MGAAFNPFEKILVVKGCYDVAECVLFAATVLAVSVRTVEILPELSYISFILMIADKIIGSSTIYSCGLPATVSTDTELIKVRLYPLSYHRDKQTGETFF